MELDLRPTQTFWDEVHLCPADTFPNLRFTGLSLDPTPDLPKVKVARPQQARAESQPYD